jgi:hypothetical protein
MNQSILINLFFFAILSTPGCILTGKLILSEQQTNYNMNIVGKSHVCFNKVVVTEKVFSLPLLTHPPNDLDFFLDLVVNCTIRAAFEYCGQKCSACGRMYVPDTLWPQVFQLVLLDWSSMK